MLKPLQSFGSLSIAAVLAAGLLLAGCKDSPDATGDKAAAASTPVSTAVIAAEAKGFVAGSQMSQRTVYVFFDAQCPHCAVLWQAAKPLKSQAKFVWIPVGILNAASTSQGATLLAAGDPVAAMDEHEASLQAGRGGISAAGSIDAQKDAVAKNTALMTRLGFSSIPSIVGTHAQTGALVTREGAMPTAALAALLGLQVPAGLPGAPIQ
ncbi:thiol:disulfide interchange protein DsbG [Polaromonas sp. YR568]|uniref:thioredoxin fold domain-containing protein n=1 Tax=Polaromonas sp. YR568 TaxID=1855301 RepID=UPI0008F1637A|nr:thioredoxin fold domain-containing protein [Polaromonas sp. YR568]SFU48143.1 thiol:disulfide interchange protein DsbG [Polaromonas sp. YR568]